MEKITQENLNREEELQKLEKLHKQALAKRVTAIHRSTKTLFKSFQGVHFWFRDRVRWYYKWHTSRLSTFIHWLVFLSALGGLIFLSTVLKNTIDYKNSIPQKQLSIVDMKNIGNDKIASQEEKSNIKIEHSKVTLEDKEITIGFLRAKADLGGLVSWKNVLWSADTPLGTSIVYRIKISDQDTEDAWNKVPWSNYYPISGVNITDKGIPAIKSKFMLVEITLEGQNGHAPTLNYLKFGYLPFQENKTIVFLRDKIVSFFVKIFKSLEKREGIQ